MSHRFQITIERSLFRASDSPFAVLQGTCQDGHLKTLCGDLSSFGHGDRIEVTANASEHPRFGQRWKVEEATILEPDDRPSRKAFLESIDGIGPGRADQLLDLFGEDVFARIDEAPERVFSELPGVGKRPPEKPRKVGGSDGRSGRFSYCSRRPESSRVKP